MINIFWGYRLWVTGYRWSPTQAKPEAACGGESGGNCALYCARRNPLAQFAEREVTGWGRTAYVLRFDYLPTFPRLWLDSTPRVRVIRQPVMR